MNPLPPREAPPPGGEPLRQLWISGTDRDVLDELDRTLSELGGPAASVATEEDLASRSPSDAVVVFAQGRLDEATCQRVERWLARSNASRALVLVRSAQRNQVGRLLRSGLRNLLALTVPDRPDLRVTLTQLLRGQGSEVEKYLKAPLTEERFTLTASPEKAELSRRSEAFLKRCPALSPRLVGQFRQATEELITNAVFNAPVDRHGRPRFRHLDRRKDVSLDASEAIQVRFLCDERRLAVSVTDGFGSLTPELLQRYLSTSLEDQRAMQDSKSGGAGLGLRAIFEATSQLVVTIVPGRSTRVTGLMDREASYREFTVRTKSLSLFVATDVAR